MRIQKPSKATVSMIIGVGLVCVGILSSVYIYTSHLVSEGTKNSLLESVTKQSTIQAIEVLTGNQEVKEITKGTKMVEISSVGIKAPILEGTDEATLSVSAGHFTQTVDMGERGNYCIAGHSSSRYTCVFNNLHKVGYGDEIVLTNEKGAKFKYNVTEIFVVNPEDVYVLDDTSTDRVTIITCTDNGTRRLCVVGEKVSLDEVSLLQERSKVEKIDKINEINRECVRIDFSYLLD